MKRSDRSIEMIRQMIQFADDCENGIRSVNAQYQENCKEIKATASSQMQNEEIRHKSAIRALSTKCIEISNGVRSLVQELEKLEDTIERVDKYYKRTKAKAEDCRDFPSLNTSDDYLEALKSIVSRYRTLSSKYTERTLPFLINDLNYLLSKKRRDDYAELLSMKNYAARLAAEERASLDLVKAEEQKAMEERHRSICDSITRKCEQCLAQANDQYMQTLETASDAMCVRLEDIMPEKDIQSLNRFMRDCQNRLKGINTDTVSFPKGIMPFNYLFPVDDYVSMKPVRSLLLDKCKPLVLQESFIVFPSVFDIRKPMNLLFRDYARSSVTLKSIQQIILTFLSNMPVSRLKLAIADPEHHGNSVSPFFELQRAEPDMFLEGIAVSSESIRDMITSLSETTDEILRYQLSGDEDTVYEHPDSASSTLLLIFDFPAQLDDESLQALRNILRNGSRCGIQTVLMKSKENTGSYSNERDAIIKEIENLCSAIDCADGVMTTSGLECLFPSLPESKELSGYLNRYLLTSTSLKNEGFVFNHTIKDLIVAADEDEAQRASDTLSALAQTAGEQWCNNTDISQAFPEQIALGGAYYPFSVFCGKPAEKILRNKYHITEGQGSGIRQEVAFLPYCIDTRDGFNLYVEYSEKETACMQAAVHHLMWRMLSSFPVSKLHLSIISCENSLNSITPFGELLKRVPDIFDEGICVSTEKVSDKIQRISQSVEDIMTNKLGHQHKNIIDYNIATPNRAEPLTMLVIFDYPKGFDSRKNETLNNILRNGRRCGIFTIICHNTDIAFSKYDNPDETLAPIRKNAVQVLCKNGKTYLQPYGIELDLKDIPDNTLVSDYTAKYEKAYALLQRKGLSFTEIADTVPFQRSSAKELTIPIGLGDGDAVISVRFGTGSSHHALIAGATGSGKSTLLHTLIMSSMIHYSPDQLHLYLLDFKSGTEFKAYEKMRLPHMKLLALDAMQEFGESILEDLVKEMTARGDEFKRAGCSKVEEYIRTTGKPMPRILVIMDEFQILYNDATNRRVANNCAELTKRIVTEGRAFGIHLIMATQSTKVIANLALESGTVEQMRIRIGMKCGESDARYLFGDRNDNRALQMMKGPIGTAVLNEEYTEEDNIGLRVAYCDAKTMQEYQERIAAEFMSYDYTLQIFEGNRTTEYLDYLASNGKEPYEAQDTEINLGIMIKVAPPLRLTVDRRRRHNLIICGANDDMSSNLSMIYKLGVLRNKAARIVEIDGEWLVSDEFDDSLSAELEKASSRYTCCKQRNDILRQLKELNEEYKRRRNGGSGEPIFVFMRNLQYLDIVQKMMKGDRVYDTEEQKVPAAPKVDPLSAADIFDFGVSAPAQVSMTDILQTLISESSSYGIFFIVTCSDYQVVHEAMHYGENVLAKFPERIIFALGDTDADRMIEGVTVSKIPSNTVYFSDSVKRPFQFKPFVAPRREAALKYLRENGLIESGESHES